MPNGREFLTLNDIQFIWEVTKQGNDMRKRFGLNVSGKENQGHIFF